MNEQIRVLEPGALWNYFADIDAIPRASKKEAKIIAFMKAFGEKLQLPTYTDAAGNVIIKKAASKGMENRQTVVLQSHLDMVHQKNADTSFDFETQGIEMFTDGDWVKAKGTTLGADNGIGVAAIMTLLASADIAHPAIEALFTIDEETGMTGAKELRGGLLDGKILLNLDTEDDDELTIGCAGGIDVTAEGSYPEESIPAGYAGLKISLTGLTGGHSGVDIHLGRANANKLMNRLLWQLAGKYGIYISSVNGGSLRNAIPRESVAVIAVAESSIDAVKHEIKDYEQVIKAEYLATDAALTVSAEATVTNDKYANQEISYSIIRGIYACPNGIYRMTPGIEGLVQTSNNIAKVSIANGKLTVQCLTRSSVDTEKMDLAQSITAAFEGCGAKTSFGSEYPGWAPQPDAPVIKLMEKIYKELFGDNIHVNAIHAGLECGIIGGNYPGMQMVSFGPNIYGAHSPDERVQISSVQKFWKYLLTVLKEFPLKN
ncbi:MAG: aminoacyl-histidine dipeptidase [Ferruginibacter sp.]